MVSEGVTGCPSDAAFGDSLARELGREGGAASEAVAPVAPDVDIVVRVVPAPRAPASPGHTDGRAGVEPPAPTSSEEASGALRATLSITRAGRTTTRNLAGDSCGDVVAAAAFVAALAIEEEKRRAAPPPEASPLEPSPPEASPPIPLPAEPSADVRARAPAPPVADDRVVLAAQGLATLGLVPSPSTGVGASARVRVASRTWLAARGFWVPRAAMFNDSFAVQLFAGGAGLCNEPFATQSVAAVFCGHVLAGSLDVVNARSALADAGSAFFAAAALSGGARARVAGPLHVEGLVEAQIPFNRATFVTTDCPPVGFQPAFAALVVGFGVGASIW